MSEDGVNPKECSHGRIKNDHVVYYDNEEGLHTISLCVYCGKMFIKKIPNGLEVEKGLLALERIANKMDKSFNK